MIRKLVRGPVALVDIPAPGAEGVLFAHGSRFGRHALYVKDNRLYHAYNFVGIFEQKIDGTEDVPAGENLILSASFDKDGEDPPGVSTGLLSLYQGEKKVGERRTKTQPGLFSIAGEGLCVGRDSGEHVTSDYPSGNVMPTTGPMRSHGSRRSCRRSAGTAVRRTAGPVPVTVSGSPGLLTQLTAMQ